MAEPQAIEYKVIINGVDFSSDFLGGSVGVGANQFATANFGIDNKGRKHAGSPDITGSNSVVISGSFDGGASFARLFSGSMLRNSTVYGGNDPDSIQISARDDRLNHIFVSFNNAVQKGKDIGAVFSGSPNDSQGNPWFDQDTEGNWPDGLLRDTGFGHDGVADIYGGIDDVALFVHGNTPIVNAINIYSKNFALDYFTDINNNAFILRSHNSDYPVEPFTISFAGGEDINKSSLQRDSSKKVSGVTVVGRSPIWFSFGTPPYHYVFDEDITTFPNARQRAESVFNRLGTDILRGGITTPPVTASVLGKKITVADPDHGWAGVGNVVGVRHVAGPERWTTKIEFEEAPRALSQTVTEVLENLEELQDKEDKGGAFMGLLKVDKNTLPATASDKGGQAVAAMAYGSSAAIPTDPAPHGMVGIVPIGPRLEGSKAAFFIVPELEQTFDFTGSSLNIKELSFLTNNNDGKPYETVNDISITDGPTANGQIFTFSLERFTEKVNWVEVNGPFFKWNSPDVTIDWYQRGPGDNTNPLTSSFWEDPAKVSKETLNLGRASWDKFSKSDAASYASHGFTLSGGEDQFGYMITIRTGIGKNAGSIFDFINHLVRARSDYARSGRKNGILIQYWDNDLVNWGLLQASSQVTDLGKWHAQKLAITSGFIAAKGISPFFDEEGACRFRVELRNDADAGSTGSYDVAYQQEFFNLRDNPVLIERGEINLGARLTVNYPIGTVYGIFSSSDASGVNLLTEGEEVFTEIFTENKLVGIYNPPTPSTRTETTRFSRDFTGLFTKEGTSLLMPPPKDWIFVIDEWKRLFGDHIGKGSLFLKYNAEGKAGATQRLTLDGGVTMDRTLTGANADVYKMMMPEDTTQQVIPYNFAGGPAKYASMSFNHFARVSDPAEGGYARFTDNVGLDKTREKSLSVLFVWPDGPTENVGGGGRGARGSGDVNLYPV